MTGTMRREGPSAWDEVVGDGPYGPSIRAKTAARRCLGVVFCLLSVMAGCADDSGSESGQLPDVDYAYFVARIQPVLEAKCAFFACHGNMGRRFQIYAVTRLREIPDPDPIFQAPRPLTPAELERNFRNAAGMLYGFEDNPEESLLLSKPVSGGTRHGGATLFGGPNVFTSREDPDFKTLLEWARGARLEE